MIHKVENITDDELDKIRKIVGEAFVSNELFHNWGTEDERRAIDQKYSDVTVNGKVGVVTEEAITNLMEKLEKNGRISQAQC